jgi:4a-hydroxytetrahydrobiopterin dehydratase
MNKLNKQAIQDSLKTIDSNWRIKDQSLHREFLFKDFVKAFSFMTSVAFLAEKAGHHPNWKNSYNKVTIALSTHEEGGITAKDFDLAKAIDSLLTKPK